MDEITLRDYRPGDWEAMYALDLVCFEPVFQFSRRAMRGFAEEPGAVTLLAEVDDELAGFCIAHLEENTGYVVTLDVAPAWRRRGIARLLMEEVEARVRAEGGIGMALHVYVGNVGAMQFYEGLGYGRVSSARGFYGRGMDALVYRKKLL
jgi:ribosomal-protein-alanine N-acetyltransferase